MKRIKIGALISVLLLCTAQSHAASVSLSPAASTVGVGNNFFVNLMIDFSSEPTLGGGIDINYNTGLADFVSFTFNNDFLALSDPAFTCPGSGACSPIDQTDSVHNIAFGNFGGIGGVFHVGTLEFSALSEGSIYLQSAATTGSGGPFVSATSFNPMSVDFLSATVTAVPVPAAAWLFFSGLGLLQLFRKR